MDAIPPSQGVKVRFTAPVPNTTELLSSTIGFGVLSVLGAGLSSEEQPIPKQIMVIPKGSRFRNFMLLVKFLKDTTY